MTPSQKLALSLVIPIAAQADDRHTWARVRALPADSVVKVRLIHTAYVPPAMRFVTGMLESASDDSVVLRLGNSALHSIPMPSIRNLKVYQPPRKRYLAQICSGLTAAFMFGWIPRKLYGVYTWFLLSVGAGVTAPVVYFTFRRARWKLIYRAGSRSPPNKSST